MGEILPVCSNMDIMSNEVSQRMTDAVCCYLDVESKNVELIDTVDWWLPGAERWGERGNVSLRVQTLSPKMNKFGGSNI